MRFLLKNRRYLAAFFFISTLLLISLFHYNKYFIPKADHYEKILKRYTENLHHDQIEFEETLQYIEKKVSNGESVDRTFEGHKYPIFLFKNGHLHKWNDHNYAIDFAQIDIRFNQWRSHETKIGTFLTYTKFIADHNNNTYALLGIIPLNHTFQLTSQYLKDYSNKDIFDINISISKKKREGYYPLAFASENEIYVGFESNISDYNRSSIYYLFSLIFALILFVFFSFWKHSGSWKESIFFIIALLCVRLYLLSIDLRLFSWTNPIFDPQVFAFSWFMPSLGDVFLHVLVLFILLVYFFFCFDRKEIVFFLKRRSVIYQKSIVSIIIFLIFLIAFHFTLLFHRLYEHSTYNFNILESIEVDPTRVFYILLFVIATSIFMISTSLLHALLKVLKKKIKKFVYTIWVISAVMFTILYYLEFTSLFIPCAFLVFTLVVSKVKLYNSFFRYSYKTYVFVIVSAIYISLAVGSEISNKSKKTASYQKHIMAENLLYLRDPKSEFFINEVSRQISNNSFIKRMFQSPGLASKELISQKINYSYIATYFDQYEGSVLIFDARGKGYLNHGVDLQNILNEFKKGWYQTEYPGQFFKRRGGTENSKYAEVIPVKINGSIIGSLVLILEKKTLEGKKILPVLVGGNDKGLKEQYNYALFREGGLSYSVGKFDYNSPEIITAVNQDANKLDWTSDGYAHYLLKDSEGNAIVVSNQSIRFKSFFDNYAFHFLIITVLLFVIVMFRYIYLYAIKKQIPYTSKIQVYLNIAFSVPLLVISITIISVTNSNDAKESQKSFEKKAKHLSALVYDQLNDSKSVIEFKNAFKNIAYYSQSDLSVFTPGGKLIVASQPLIYEAGLIAKWINPVALKGIKTSKQKAVFLDENIGSFYYRAIYIALVNNETGNLLAILRVPSFQTTQTLKQNRITVFTSILEIFTIIFLLIAVLSQFSFNALARPLRFISEGLRKTSLSSKNEPLEWQPKDEIGELVREYNEMILKLEASKKALARTEKESAWREMAQQVAHEIKNPLTPMKLKIQHILRRLSKDENDKKNQLEAVLKQIDILSDIATSFSVFAKMPAPINSPFDIVELVKEVTTLYENEEKFTIQKNIAPTSLIVNADRNLFGRIISNLIINGHQAMIDVKNNDLIVSLSTDSMHETMILSISDNGKGISSDIQPKVFLPNFTTKENGSGIGLAIAKRGVEHAGGKIWFHTKEGEGTTFYIELPIYRNE